MARRSRPAATGGQTHLSDQAVKTVLRRRFEYRGGLSEIGYARASAGDQSVDLQGAALRPAERTSSAYPALAIDVTLGGGIFEDGGAVVDGNYVSSRAWPDNGTWMKAFIEVLDAAGVHASADTAAPAAEASAA